MPPGLELGLVFFTFLVLLGCGMAVPLAIGVPAVFYLFLQGGFDALRGLGIVSVGSMESSALTAIPLFMLMAELLQRGGVSQRVYRGLSKLFAPLPGGLLQTNIVGCALFSAISGSSVATAAAIGKVALPQLIARKYDRALSAGSLAAGGTLGILIPPSLVMIIYGAFTDTSVARLFMAGVVPGILLTLMFMVYTAVHVKLKPSTVPTEKGPESLQELFQALADVLPFVFLIVLTFGSLYVGLATPTEAAALGCILAVIVNIIWGKFSWLILNISLSQTIKGAGNILFIIFSAYLFSYAMTYAGIGEEVTSYIVGLKLSKLEFFLVIFLLYTVLGCLVEGLGMIVITVPLLFPVLTHYGVDPVFFGVVLVLFVELGMITPPIGINLFVIQSIWKGKLSEVVKGTIPFHIIMFLLLFMLVLWPEIALWLPNKMKGH